jgi:hypothetical protein
VNENVPVHVCLCVCTCMYVCVGVCVIFVVGDESARALPSWFVSDISCSLLSLPFVMSVPVVVGVFSGLVVCA